MHATGVKRWVVQGGERNKSGHTPTSQSTLDWSVPAFLSLISISFLLRLSSFPTYSFVASRSQQHPLIRSGTLWLNTGFPHGVPIASLIGSDTYFCFLGAQTSVFSFTIPQVWPPKCQMWGDCWAGKTKRANIKHILFLLLRTKTQVAYILRWDQVLWFPHLHVSFFFPKNSLPSSKVFRHCFEKKKVIYSIPACSH